MVQTFDMSRRDNSTNKAISIVRDWITMLKKASEARVNRRRRRYYLIVLLLPNIFTLACLPLSSIKYNTGQLMTVKSPLSAAPCRLVTETRRYLIEKNPSSILGLGTMLRKASEARVNRRWRRYYLIVLLLLNIFTLACRPLSSI